MVKKEKYILLDKYIDFLLENSDASSPMWKLEADIKTNGIILTPA